jgi:hypothetical protein
MQLLIFLILSLVGLWVILWESRPRKLELSQRATLLPTTPEPLDPPREP